MTRTPDVPSAAGAVPEPVADIAARPVIADLPACHGVLAFASPARLAAAAALAGAALRPVRRLLMLEVGSGVGLAVQAAALAGTGTTILAQAEDPAEAAHAAALLAEAGLEGAAEVVAGPPSRLAARLDARFDARLDVLGDAQGDARPDAAEFDLAVMPWGWDLLPEAERAALIGLLARRLARGGGFMLTRSVAPGALSVGALRQLTLNRWDAAADIADPAARMARTLEEAERVTLLSHRFMRGAVDWAQSRDEMRRLPPRVFARIWGAPRPAPQDSRSFAAALAPAGLVAWTPADPLRLARSFDMTEAQQAEIYRCADPFEAAEVADLMLMRQTRSDLFLKAGGPAAEPGALELLPVPGAAEAVASGIRVEGLLGPMTLARAAYLPVLDALEQAGGGGPARLDAAARRLGLETPALTERAAVLLSAGFVLPAPHGAAGPPQAARDAAARLSEILLRRGIADVLPDPVTAGALPRRGTGVA